MRKLKFQNWDPYLRLKHSTFHLTNRCAYHTFFFFNNWILWNRGPRIRGSGHRGEIVSCCPLSICLFLFPIPSLELSLPQNPEENRASYVVSSGYNEITAVNLWCHLSFIDRMETLGNKPTLCYNQEFWAIHRSTSGYHIDIGECDPLKRLLSVTLLWTNVNMLCVLGIL